jgi:hypothetical protein
MSLFLSLDRWAFNYIKKYNLNEDVRNDVPYNLRNSNWVESRTID